MRALASLLCLLSTATVSAEEAVLLGQVVDPGGSATRIRVCGSDTIIRLGVMASNQHVWFMRKLSEASEAGPVLVEVRGEISGDTLERMDIITVETGVCDAAGT